MSASSSKSESKPIIPPHVQRAMDQQMNRAQDTLGESFIGPDGLVAGSNEAIDMGQQALMNAAQGGMGQLGQAGSQALQGFLQGDSPILQQRLQDIASMGTRNLNENLLPGIRTGAVQAGQAGSSRHGIAEGIAARGAAEAVTRGQTDLLANAERQRQAAIGQIGGVQQNLAQPGLTMGAVGAQQRDIQQQQMQEGLLRQQAELQRLGGLGNMIQQQAAPQIGQESSSSSKTMDLGAAAGAVTSIGGMLLGGI